MTREPMDRQKYITVVGWSSGNEHHKAVELAIGHAVGRASSMDGIADCSNPDIQALSCVSLSENGNEWWSAVVVTRYPSEPGSKKPQ